MYPPAYPASWPASGFTLIELLITISILAVLAAVGVPIWQGLADSHRVNADLRSVRQALSYARHQAVTTGLDVSVCPADAKSTGCGGKQDWQQGWIVFTGRAYSADKVLRVGGQLDADSVTVGRKKIVFNPYGEARGSNDSWHFCAGSSGRSLILAASGRIRQAAKDCQ